MASLQSSCLVLSTNHKSPSTAARRFHVSCSGGGGVDRRDLLLGLGGLYGATAANLNARAEPTQPPDMKACGVPDVGGVPIPNSKFTSNFGN
ncbi:catechol oxidase [Salvia divinorum]|uniref:Catechol oxidase n=1 Tax=Salvia divinorum TaxID=28513 RepID=A0ABD1G0K5_SALDI